MDGKNYSLDDLNRLLYIVNRENTITISLYNDEITALEKLRGYLSEDVVAIPQKLNDILKSIVDTFDISVDEPTTEMKQLVNYLDREITDMKATIVSFMQRNSKLSSRKFNQIVEILQTIMWKGDSNDFTNIKTVQIF